MNKQLTDQERNNFQLVLSKESLQDSLAVLENAHYSLGVTIAKLKEEYAIEHQQMITVLDEELQIIKEEIARLHRVIHTF